MGRGPECNSSLPSNSMILMLLSSSLCICVAVCFLSQDWIAESSSSPHPLTADDVTSSFVSDRIMRASFALLRRGRSIVRMHAMIPASEAWGPVASAPPGSPQMVMGMTGTGASVSLNADPIIDLAQKKFTFYQHEDSASPFSVCHVM